MMTFQLSYQMVYDSFFVRGMWKAIFQSFLTKLIFPFSDPSTLPLYDIHSYTNKCTHTHTPSWELTVNVWSCKDCHDAFLPESPWASFSFCIFRHWEVLSHVKQCVCAYVCMCVCWVVMEAWLHHFREDRKPYTVV